MIVTAIRTAAVKPGDSLLKILHDALPSLPDHAVVAITSKIVAICEGSLVPIEAGVKAALIYEQAERYLPPHGRYGVSITTKHRMLIANAGIDESNSQCNYVLWPADPQATTNSVRAYLRGRFGHDNLGVLVVDSKTTPLRWGVTGTALAHSGFAALNDYVGELDIFGRPFVFEKANIADGLAATAAVVMGEGAEQTPIAIIEDLPFVSFQSRDPTTKELADLTIALEDDLYSQLLTSVEWIRGGAAGIE